VVGKNRDYVPIRVSDFEHAMTGESVLTNRARGDSAGRHAVAKRIGIIDHEVKGADDPASRFTR